MTLTLSEYRARLAPDPRPEPRLDQALIDRATDAYVATYLHVGSAGRSNGGGDGPYEGRLVDDVLADGGVTFGQNRRLYLAYERAIRAQANEQVKTRTKRTAIEPEEAETIRRMIADGMTHRDIARRMGRSMGTISKVRRGEL